MLLIYGLSVKKLIIISKLYDDEDLLTFVDHIENILNFMRVIKFVWIKIEHETCIAGYTYHALIMLLSCPYHALITPLSPHDKGMISHPNHAIITIASLS